MTETNLISMEKRKTIESETPADYSIFPNAKVDADEVRFRKFSLIPEVESLQGSLHSGVAEPEVQDPVEIRSKIRRNLFKSEVSATGDSDSDEVDYQNKSSCARKAKKCFERRIKKFNEVSATNLKIKTGVEAGLWDKWGVYYCSNRFGRHSTSNYSYFALAALFLMGQGSMLNLIYYMNKHGGAAFLVVLSLVYISVGYPMYLFETMMGQYSGRKPLQMIRFMLPALTGIGPALYLRTIVKAVNALAIFIYCAYLVFKLFFCKPTEVHLIHRFLNAEAVNRKFSIFKFRVFDKLNDTTDENQHLYHFWWLIIFTVALFILVAQKIKLLGNIMAIFVRIFLLAMAGYLIVGVIRAYEADSGSIVYLPIIKTMTPDWKKLISGLAWLDAMIFVIQSMELGTLVHPYLGSKSFFHYRSPRDGLHLTLLAIVWNVGTAVAALAWLGYVGVNTQQIEVSTQQLFGHYGLFVVFMLKHMQAEMTGNVQGDVLFFNAFFYSIVGLLALSALVVYIIIIVDCSYPESGHLILKLLIMIVAVIFFGFVAPICLLQEDGLRYLIFINFYVHKSWSAFFIVACYFGAVAFGHDMGKFVHDFLNIVHIKGYQSKQHSYHVPRALRYLVLMFLGIGMVCYAFTRPYPHEGLTDWTDDGQYVGIGFSVLPLLTVFTIIIYYRAKSTGEPFQPHRDWYKNKHHTAVCFADFAHFKGIPELLDPEIPEKKTRRSRKSSHNPNGNRDAKPEETM